MKSNLKIKKTQNYSFLIVSIVMLLSLVVLVFAFSNKIGESQKKDMLDEVSQSCQLQVGKFNDYCVMVHSQFDMLNVYLASSENGVFSDEVVSYNGKNYSNVVLNSISKNYLSSMIGASMFSSAFIINVDGNYCLEKDGNKSVVSIKDDEYFKDALDGNYSALYTNGEATNSDSSITLFEAIKSDSTTIGVLAATIKLENPAQYLTFFDSSSEDWRYILVDSNFQNISPFHGFAGNDASKLLTESIILNQNEEGVTIFNSDSEENSLYIKSMKVSPSENGLFSWYVVGLFKKSYVEKNSMAASQTAESYFAIALFLLFAIFAFELLLVNGMQRSSQKEIEKYNEAFSRFGQCTFEYDIRDRSIELSPYAMKMLNAKNRFYRLDDLASEIGISAKDVGLIRDSVLKIGYVENVSFNSYVESIDKYIKVEMYALSMLKSKNHPYIMGIVEDITAHVVSRKSLEMQVKTDGLTKLSNRETIIEAMKENLLLHKENLCAFMMIDLDEFKQINDTYGHFVGDRLLQKIGVLFSIISKKQNVHVARLSGDEFAVFVPTFKSIKEIQKLAILICSEIDTLQIMPDVQRGISVSIGIATYPTNADNVEKLCQCADNALYKSKRIFGSAYTFYNNIDTTVTTVSDKTLNEEENSVTDAFARLMSLGTDGHNTVSDLLKKAMQVNEIELYFQPRVSSDGKEVGAEVLSRWKSEEYGMVMPGQFLPMFEFCNLSIEFDKYVLEKTFSLIREHGLLESNINISVNQSLAAFIKPFYAREVEELMKTYGIKKGMVTIEITERKMFMSLRTISKVIANIRNLGLNISIDDFGTGYTTLNILKDLDVDEIKVDKSFLQLNDKKSTTITSEMVEMANKLGVLTVAEGVENEEQVKFLVDIGCSFLQGYFFAKAEPIDVFLEKRQSGEYANKLKNVLKQM